MKKFIFLATIAATVVASCAKDPLSKEDAPKSGMVKYTATVSFEDTKAYLDGLKVVWEEGDKVAIFDDVNAEANEFTVTSVSAGSATISGEIAQGATTLWGVYPFSSAVKIVEDDTLFVTVPAVQEIPTGKNIAKDAIVSVAKAAVGADLGFKNAVSLVKINVAAEGMNKVVFSSLDGTVGVTGAMGAIIDDGEIDVKLSGKTSLTVTKADGFAQGSDYYAAVFAQDVTGIKFVFTSTSSKSLVSSDKIASFALNGGLNFAFTEQQLEDGAFPLNIATKADLDKFAANAALYEAGEWVKLTADIDYDSGEWITPSEFYGNLDGQNHSIYNILIKANSDNHTGLIGIARATAQFKDLKLGYNGTGYDGVSTIAVTRGSDKSRVGSIVAIASKCDAKFDNIINYIPITLTNTEALASEFRIGGIVGELTGGTGVSVKNCKNYGNIAIDHSFKITGSQYYAGIAGLISSTGCTVDSCENYGNVTTNDAVALAGNVFIGGIVGRLGSAYDGVVINKCSNSGELYTLMNHGSSNQPYIGGIIGADNDAVDSETPKVKVLYCTNSGLVKCTNQSAGAHLGGIAGFIKANSLIDNCTNSGQILKDGNFADNTYYGGIVGRATASAIGESMTSNCVNNGVVLGKGQTSKKTICSGGIMGIAYAPIKDCTNNAEVKTEGTGNGALCVGGIIGTHGNGSAITGCCNYGDVTLSNTYASSACGGIVGRQNDNETSTFEGCVVNCKVSSAGASGFAGMILGNFNGKTPVFNCGTAESPVKVGGSLNNTPITSENLKSSLCAGTNKNATYNVVLYTE